MARTRTTVSRVRVQKDGVYALLLLHVSVTAPCRRKLWYEWLHALGVLQLRHRLDYIWWWPQASRARIWKKHIDLSSGSKSACSSIGELSALNAGFDETLLKVESGGWVHKHVDILQPVSIVLRERSRDLRKCIQPRLLHLFDLDLGGGGRFWLLQVARCDL